MGHILSALIVGFGLFGNKKAQKVVKRIRSATRSSIHTVG